MATLRAAVVALYGVECYLCHLDIDVTVPRTSPAGLTIEHVTPRSLGGTDDLTNLRPAHHHCNVSRGNRPPKTHRPRERAPWL